MSGDWGVNEPSKPEDHLTNLNFLLGPPLPDTTHELFNIGVGSKSQPIGRGEVALTLGETNEVVG